VLRGDTVDFGLGRISLHIKGTFEGSHAGWNPEKHRLVANTVPSRTLREALQRTSVKILGETPDPHGIRYLLDVTTGETNRLLTRGGVARLAGQMIKIAGSDPGIGLWLTSHDSGERIPVPANVIGVNLPSELCFGTPVGLTPGRYDLCVVTQFTPGRLLAEPCTIPLAYVIDVI
jgi:hypothetical protein